MLKLSIIVPVYNVADYIEKCIVSLEDQDIPQNEYEIIVINDGSPDNSREIVLRLQKRYNNIILIDQENQGVSMARNNGIEHAKGLYIMPIDPDDFVLPNTFKQILKKAIDNDFDTLYLGFDILDENGKHIWKANYLEMEGEIFSGVEAYFAARGKTVKDPDRSVAILFKRGFLEKFQIEYPKDVPYLEDGLFLAKVFCSAESCGFDATPFYQRTTRIGSATNSRLFYSEKALNGFLKAAIDIREFRQKNKLSTEQIGLVNHVIAKFVLLPITSCVAAWNLKAYKKIKRLIIDKGFSKLDLSGCRADFYKNGRQYNQSKDWFFIYYSYLLMLKSLRYRLNRLIPSANHEK